MLLVDRMQVNLRTREYIAFDVLLDPNSCWHIVVLDKKRVECKDVALGGRALDYGCSRSENTLPGSNAVARVGRG